MSQNKGTYRTYTMYSATLHTRQEPYANIKIYKQKYKVPGTRQRYRLKPAIAFSSPQF